VIVAAALVIGGCSGGDVPRSNGSADLVLTNARVVTMDAAQPEAEAVAVRDGRILAVGTASSIEAYVGPGTDVRDLGGRLVTPGLIEGHGHFLSLGVSKMILDLTEAETWDEIVALVAGAVSEAEPGAWIEGRGWHQEKWTTPPDNAVEGVPVHTSLSEVSPNNPVNLGHASGHASFANQLAMERAGIGAATPDPEGGTIVRDSDGAPTGMMRETAQRLIGAAIETSRSEWTEGELDAEFREKVRLAGEEALRYGVTSFQDAGATFAEIDRFKRLADEGTLPVRLYVMVRRESNESMAARLADYRMVGYGDNFLTVRSIKRQIDGALGSHGAWLLDDYIDLASPGLVLEAVEDIRRTAEIAIAAGFQVNTHAIGDRANREVLDIYEQVFADNPDQVDLRWRIEHAQHLAPEDVPRFAELGIIAAMQGVHCTSDAPWVFARLGAERAESGAYLWRDLIDAGVVVGNGTDTPVERIDPIASFYSSVTRRTATGEAFFPEQAMTREEALRSYTLWNAQASFSEDVLGSIVPGKLADLAVFSVDIMTVPEDEIPLAQIDLTIVGGEVRYDRMESDGGMPPE